MKKKRSSIFDELSKTSSSQKEKIIKINENLKDDESVNTSSNKKIGRRIDNTVIHFEENDSDSVFMSSLKSLINDMEIMKEDFYEMVGDRAKAYSLYYSFNKGKNSFNLFEQMLEALNKELVVEYYPIEDKIKESKKKAKNKNKTKDNSNTLGRSVENYIIEFDIYEDDNLLQETLKSIINERQLEKEELYDKVGRKHGYAMIYEVQKGVSSFRLFEEWINVLDYEFTINFVDK